MSGTDDCALLCRDVPTIAVPHDSSMASKPTDK